MNNNAKQQRKPSDSETIKGNTEFLQLVGNASLGDSEAISALCAEIARDVLFRTTRILNNHSDAEDAAQEALLRVCKNIRQLKDPIAFRKWLSSIVVNEARRQMMQNAKHCNILYLSDELDSAPEENEDFLPEAYIENEENRKIVIEALDKLPLRQKEAIVLHYYDRLSVTETAEVMGIPQPSVSLYLKHARNKIKSEIESKANWAKGVARGFTFLPIGTALTRVLSVEGTAFAPTTSAWLPNVLAKCFESAQLVATEATATASASAAEGSTSATITQSSATTAISAKTGLITITALVASVTVIFAAILGAPANTGLIQKDPTNAVGEIAFKGENAAHPYLNPESAEVITDSISGELIIIDWNITVAGTEDVIYSGENDFSDGILNQMRANGMDGEYMLMFQLKDANGDIYKLGHSFIIDTGAG